MVSKMQSETKQETLKVEDRALWYSTRRYVDAFTLPGTG
jgi:hypothetical protein